MIPDRSTIEGERAYSMMLEYIIEQRLEATLGGEVFDAWEAKLTAKMDDVKSDLEDLESSLKDTDKAVARNLERIEKCESDMLVLENSIENVESEVSDLERKLDQNYDELDRKIDNVEHG